MKDEEIKAIERCKELIKENHSCWIGITNQVAIETVLNLIEKQKAEIEEKQDDINVLEAQRDSIENQFEQAKAEIEKLNFYLSASEQEHNYDIKMIDEVKGEAVKLYKMIDLMAEKLKQLREASLDDCFIPRSYRDIDDCLRTTCEECIKEYFENKVKEMPEQN